MNIQSGPVMDQGEADVVTMVIPEMGVPPNDPL
jgi:hypothetical protein